MERPSETPSVPPPGNKKPSLLDTLRSRQFLAGFFGWYAVNGVVWYILKSGSLEFVGEAILVNAFAFPINILALIVFSIIKRTRKFGFGLLAAIALNLLLSILLGVFFNGICFVPFFFNTN